MATLSEQEIEAAYERGRLDALNQPYAVAAHFDKISGHVVMDLSNNCQFAFPTSTTQGLELASFEDLSEVEILGTGYGLHWETLDVDLSIPGLLAGIFGTAYYMARKGGRATSKTKAAAARSNGAKGGRPRKAVA